MFTYDLTDEEYALPYNAPGTSKSYFDLDDDFRDFVPKRRADAIKLETILGNSGDMDIETVGGPTGFAGEGLDKGVRAYQKRNGLKVDGWVRPGGPTITKMKEQFGGLLGDYEAPSPRQSDTHHRMRDAGLSGFLKPKRQDLQLPPIPGLPMPNDNVLGGNHSLVRTVRDKGMQNAAGYMAGQVRHLGQEGVVEARDFVDQLDKLIPGEGTKAIRGILQSLADIPGLQRAFFGGPVIETAPIGVFEPDGPQRFDEAMKTKPWEEAELGRKVPGANQTREWDEARDGPVLTPQLRPITDAEAGKHQIQSRDAGADANTPPNPTDLLDPRNWTMQVHAAEGEGREGAERPDVQEAQARQQRNPTHIDRYFDDLDKRVQELAKRWNTDPNFIHAILSLESGWFDDKARARNNPFGYTVQPNSAAERAGQQAGMPTEISSLDRAFQQWSDKWGPRIRESKNMHDFLENIQRGGADTYNKVHSVYNENRPKFDARTGERIKSYEEKIEEQYRTILNRRQLWEQSRR